MSNLAILFMILCVIGAIGLAWTYYSQKHSKHTQ